MSYIFKDTCENLELCISAMAEIIDGPVEYIEFSKDELRAYDHLYESCKEFIHYFQRLSDIPGALKSVE